MNQPAGSFFSDVDGSGASDEAARYLTFAAERAADMRRQGYERMEIGEGCSVLDVGCGLGEVCADLVERVGPSGRVVGVDVSEAMIARARERCGDLPVEFGIGDAEALVFDDATFDAVRAERVVQHLDDPATAIAEMARVARPGGKVFVLDPVHDASVVATEHPEVWEAIRAHGQGGVRQPRAGLFLNEWMRAAGLEVSLVVGARIIDDWPSSRMLGRFDDAAARAVNAGALTTAQVEDFVAEQERRFEQGVFAQSIFFVQALGTKHS